MWSVEYSPQEVNSDIWHLTNFKRIYAMRYEAPDTKEEAVSLLVKEEGIAHILAGGTDLLVQ